MRIKRRPHPNTVPGARFKGGTMGTNKGARRSAAEFTEAERETASRTDPKTGRTAPRSGHREPHIPGFVW